LNGLLNRSKRAVQLHPVHPDRSDNSCASQPPACGQGQRKAERPLFCVVSRVDAVRSLTVAARTIQPAHVYHLGSVNPAHGQFFLIQPYRLALHCKDLRAPTLNLVVFQNVPFSAELGQLSSSGMCATVVRGAQLEPDARDPVRLRRPGCPPVKGIAYYRCCQEVSASELRSCPLNTPGRGAILATRPEGSRAADLFERQEPGSQSRVIRPGWAVSVFALGGVRCGWVLLTALRAGRMLLAR